MIEIRIRFGKSARGRFSVETEERAAELRSLARLLMRAKVESMRAKRMLADAALAGAAEFKAIAALAAELGSGAIVASSNAPSNVATYRKVAEEWTSQELHRRFPDNVAKIKHEFNIQRFERHVYPVIGDVPIRDVTREHCDEVMRRLPAEVKSRRHIAALVCRVLNLAELAGYIDRNPLPRGWLPKPLPRKLWAVLYPAEDGALLACRKIPLAYRVLYGFLHRELMRKSEATNLRWRDINLEMGTVELEATKTNSIRAWPLGPGVADALKAWWKLRGEPGPDEPVFTDENGGPWVSEHMAVTLRLHLKAAGLTRAALFAKGDLRGRFGLHSFRRSGITRNLALGKTSDFVTRRSGHETDAMLKRYRQNAGALAELALGEVESLANAIPELASTPNQPPALVAAGPGSGLQSGPRMLREGGGIGRRTSLRC